MMSFSRAALLLAAAVAATPAAATDLSIAYSYNFLSATDGSQTGGDNAVDRTTTVGGKPIKVTATGWNATRTSGGYNYTRGWVGQYTGGLGITSDGNDLDGDWGMHQIDNGGVKVTTGRNAQGQSVTYYDPVDSYDFLLLEFDTAVTLGQLSRNSYGAPNRALNDWVVDNDFAWGALTGGLTAGTFAALPGLTSVNVAGECTSGYECSATDTIYTRAAASTANQSRYWAVGASLTNPDGITDAFKLGGVTAYYTAPTAQPPSNAGAVPEPATWAMLVLGFGIVGAAARRRRQAIPAA